mmetsp:Transcript_29366/g.87594  ORF Transcript_29366/g.87594 Transcript_29366/m.87594 type:complete len:283 (+) Transcript_29366:634-1482(+)
MTREAGAEAQPRPAERTPTPSGKARAEARSGQSCRYLSSRGADRGWMAGVRRASSSAPGRRWRRCCLRLCATAFRPSAAAQRSSPPSSASPRSKRACLPNQRTQTHSTHSAAPSQRRRAPLRRRSITASPRSALRSSRACAASSSRWANCLSPSLTQCGAPSQRLTTRTPTASHSPSSQPRPAAHRTGSSVITDWSGTGLGTIGPVEKMGQTLFSSTATRAMQHAGSARCSSRCLTHRTRASSSTRSSGPRALQSAASCAAPVQPMCATSSLPQRSPAAWVR